MLLREDSDQLAENLTISVIFVSIAGMDLYGGSDIVRRGCSTHAISVHICWSFKPARVHHCVLISRRTSRASFFFAHNISAVDDVAALKACTL
jgi:hypothetical protein